MFYTKGNQSSIVKWKSINKHGRERGGGGGGGGKEGGGGGGGGGGVGGGGVGKKW